ncbi:MAG: orotidine-5'-phosphate decarboxylase [Bacillota bacterium]
MKGKERLLVALDVDDWQEGRRLADLLAGVVGGFKVGMRLYYRAGAGVLAYLRERVPVVFADLKLHDIPSTVDGGVRALVAQGATLLNVHAAGGRAMMAAARDAAADEAERRGLIRPRVVAVTVLTSLDETALREEVGIPEPVAVRALAWARLAQEAGLDGVVASAWETAAIRRACGRDFIIVTPGIRPQGSSPGDQCRVVKPAEAVQAGADYLVVGRPVTGAPDPVRAVREIVASLGEG